MTEYTNINMDYNENTVTYIMNSLFFIIKSNFPFIDIYGITESKKYKLVLKTESMIEEDGELVDLIDYEKGVNGILSKFLNEISDIFYVDVIDGEFCITYKDKVSLIDNSADIIKKLRLYEAQNNVQLDEMPSFKSMVINFDKHWLCKPFTEEIMADQSRNRTVITYDEINHEPLEINPNGFLDEIKNSMTKRLNIDKNFLEEPTSQSYSDYKITSRMYNVDLIKSTRSDPTNGTINMIRY